MEGVSNAQLEEGIGNLQHQYVRVIVLMADKDRFARPSHAIPVVVFLQSLQSRLHGRIFLWLDFFRRKCVVADRVQPDCLWLVCIEIRGCDRTVDEC